MAMYAVNDEILTGIADAIRTKTGSDEPMEVSTFASAIEGISGGSGGEFTTGIIEDVREWQVNSAEYHIFDVNIGIGKSHFFAYNIDSNVKNNYTRLFYHDDYVDIHQGASVNGAGLITGGSGDTKGSGTYGHYNPETGDYYQTVKQWNTVSGGTYRWIAW